MVAQTPHLSFACHKPLHKPRAIGGSGSRLEQSRVPWGAGAHLSGMKPILLPRPTALSRC